MFAHEKIPGLPRERMIDAIEPVLRAHGLAGVELVWRTDSQGRVLVVTVESPDGAEPGAGVTLDVCSRVSRDLSTALDVAGLLDGKYRLEVGSPGLERRLYTLADYERFRGRLAKLKAAPPEGAAVVLNGRLGGVSPDGQVLIEADGREHTINFQDIRSGQLVVDWQGLGFAPRQRAGRRPVARGRQ